MMTPIDRRDAGRLLTKEEVAERLAVSVRTVDRLVAGGELPPPVKLKRLARFLQSEIDAYVKRLIDQRAVLFGHAKESV